MIPRMSGNSSAAFYRKHASDYDASAARTMALRRRTIARLGLQPGDVVLDAGCGTGLSFALLCEAVGDGGQVIGVESSPQMMALARQRVEQAGWTNVLLVEDAIERARWPVLADALLFNYTHDIVRLPAALAAIFRQSRRGARVAAAGIKHPPRWLDPLRLYRRYKSRGCYTQYEGLEAPWDLLARDVPDLQVESTLFGTGYIAWGRLAALE
jgi:ubiquinone/menaquinone biosynthesis C-methylase UbiE